MCPGVQVQEWMLDLWKFFVVWRWSQLEKQAQAQMSAGIWSRVGLLNPSGVGLEQPEPGWFPALPKKVSLVVVGNLSSSK